MLTIILQWGGVAVSSGSTNYSISITWTNALFTTLTPSFYLFGNSTMGFSIRATGNLSLTMANQGLPSSLYTPISLFLINGTIS